MQRTTPSSPLSMPPSRQPQSQVPHSPPPQNNNQSPSGQERPSLPPPDSQFDYQDQSQQRSQDNANQYEEQHNQGPPPSSQLVRYGDNPARYDPVPVDGGVVFDRVISLPPPPTTPSSRALQPYRRNQAQAQPRVYYQDHQHFDDQAHTDQQQYQHQDHNQNHHQERQGQHQQHPNRAQADLRPQAGPQAQAQAQAQPQHNRPQIEHHPTQPPTILPKPQTPRRNPFAALPLSPSTLQPASSPIPQVTPDQLSNISTRPPTDPGAASRIKQSVSAEGTTYAHAPPHNGKTLVKRASKGINGGFRVPWSAGSPQHAEAQKQKEDTGNREEEEKVDPKQVAREPIADEQQIHQSMNAKKAIQAQARKEEAAQARAEAVKQAISPQNSITDQSRDGQQVDPSRDDSRVRPASKSANANQAQNTATRVSAPRPAGQEVKQGAGREGGKEQNVALDRGQPVQSPTLAISTGQAPRSNPQGQGGRQHASPNQSDPQNQQQQERPTNNFPPNRQISSNQKVHNNGRSAQQSQRSAAPLTRPHQAQAREEHDQAAYRQEDVFDDPQARGQGKAQPQTQGQSRGRGQGQGQQRSSPSPYRQEDANTEQLGHRGGQEESDRGHGGHQDMNMDEDRNQDRDQYNKVQGHDYAYQEDPTLKGGKGKRSRTREDGPDSTRSVSKRQKQNLDVGNGSSEIEMEVEKEGEEEDASPFDAFAENEKYDHVKELQEPWNEMMDEMVPFLDEWAEKYLSTTLDTIYSMYGCFYNMSTKNAESLEQGVEDILEYQATQNEIRQTLCDFREGVASISQRLVSAPGASKSRGGTPAQGIGR